MGNICKRGPKSRCIMGGGMPERTGCGSWQSVRGVMGCLPFSASWCFMGITLRGHRTGRRTGHCWHSLGTVPWGFFTFQYWCILGSVVRGNGTCCLCWALGPTWKWHQCLWPVDTCLGGLRRGAGAHDWRPRSLNDGLGAWFWDRLTNRYSKAQEAMQEETEKQGEERWRDRLLKSKLAAVGFESRCVGKKKKHVT